MKEQEQNLKEAGRALFNEARPLEKRVFQYVQACQAGLARMGINIEAFPVDVNGKQESLKDMFNWSYRLGLTLGVPEGILKGIGEQNQADKIISGIRESIEEKEIKEEK